MLKHFNDMISQQLSHYTELSIFTVTKWKWTTINQKHMIYSFFQITYDCFIWISPAQGGTFYDWFLIFWIYSDLKTQNKITFHSLP